MAAGVSKRQMTRSRVRHRKRERERGLEGYIYILLYCLLEGPNSNLIIRMACSESGLRTQEQGLEGRGRVMGSYSLLILTPHRPQLWTTTTDFFPNPPLPSTIFFTPQVLSPSPRHPLSLSNFFFSFSFLIKITDLILLFYSQHLLFEME